jgi:hypothetical protein
MSTDLSPNQTWITILGGRTHDQEAVMGLEAMIRGGGVDLIHGEEDTLQGATAYMWMPTELLDIDVIMRDFQKQQYAVMTRAAKAKIADLLSEPSGVILTARTGKSRTVGALLAYDRNVTLADDSLNLTIDVMAFMNASEQYLYAPLLSAFNIQTMEDIDRLEKLSSEHGKPVVVSLNFSGPAEPLDRSYLVSALDLIRSTRERSAEAAGFADWDAERQRQKGMKV